MESFIDLGSASKMTSRYRTESKNVIAPEYKNQDILCTCETFDKKAVEELLAQNDCQGLRVYYGMDESNRVHAILVGVDSRNNDILTEGDTKILENGARCPIDCPEPSALNS